MSELSSEAMSRAHEIKAEEGVTMRTALKRAWDEVGGDSAEGSSTTTFKPSLLTVALLGVAGWVGYYYWKNKRMPWSGISRFKQLPIRQPRPISADSGSVILPEGRYPMPSGRTEERPQIICP